jgi:hypothetical protein
MNKADNWRKGNMQLEVSQYNKKHVWPDATDSLFFEVLN